jgi:hypothetical protein
MRRFGTSEAQFTEARTAVGLFRHYLLTAD